MNVIQYEKIGALKDGEVFEWSIPGWILNHKYSTKRSDTFSHSRIPGYEFCLTLRPYTDAAAKSVSFNLQLHRIPVFNCETKPNGDETVRGALPDMSVRFILYKLNSVHKWSCSMKMQDSRLTADFPEVSTYDSLTIQCIMMMSNASAPRLEVDTSKSEPSSSQKISNAPAESHTLAHDIESLLKSGNLSDLTLCVEDQEFNVHRCILASRSDVFAAMFNHDTKEKLESRIVIVDFSSEIMGQILKYMYSDDICDLTVEQLLSLFSAADKYAIADLRKECSLRLQKNLPLNSVIHVLVTADLHQDEGLKEAAVKIFLKNAVAVMGSEEWLPFMKNHAELASSILMRLAKNSSSSYAGSRW